MDLNIKTGVKEFNLNGKVKVEFNPSDTDFVKKLHGTFLKLESMQRQYEEESKDIPEDDADKIFEFAERKDRDMKQTIDTFFGKEVCGPLFGSMSVYGFNEDDLPIWMALFIAILDQCDAAAENVPKQGSAAMDKYIKKYQKYKR